MAKEQGKKGVKLTTEQKVAAKQGAFIRVVTPRVNKALKCIRLVGNCAASNYFYTPEQAKAITLALQVAVQGVFDAFAKKVEKQAEFNLPKV
jgi:hypothetical protein